MTTDARSLLNHLFGGVSGYFEIMYLHPDKPGSITHSYKLGVDRPDWSKVQAMNAAGYNVHYGVTTNSRRVPTNKRRTEGTALMIPCLWVDFDFKSGDFATVEDVTNHVYDFAVCPPPTAVLSSGGGVHVLWRIKPVRITLENTPILKQTLRGLAVGLKSDPSVAMLNGSLRLPNTINTKKDRGGARCALLDLLPGQFTLEDFAHYRHYAQPIARPIERDLPRYRPDTLSGYVQRYLDTPIADGNRNNELNNTALHMHSNNYDQSEAERVLLPKALADGLNERKSLRTIQSAFNAPRGTPSYIGKQTLSRIRAGEAAERKMG